MSAITCLFSTVRAHSPFYFIWELLRSHSQSPTSNEPYSIPFPCPYLCPPPFPSPCFVLLHQQHFHLSQSLFPPLRNHSAMPSAELNSFLHCLSLGKGEAHCWKCTYPQLPTSSLSQARCCFVCSAACFASAAGLEKSRRKLTCTWWLGGRKDSYSTPRACQKSSAMRIFQVFHLKQAETIWLKTKFVIHKLFGRFSVQFWG